ncbi:MAG: hypothetical protein LIP06_13990 [Tannerellaceae bacterium]|nr:hypothetical protein [Tannerellaceae bacterium]
MAHDYLIHSNEVHLINREEIHKAITQMIDTLHVAAGSTDGFDIYKVVESYFTDLDKRHEINELLNIPQDAEYYAEEGCECQTENAEIENNADNQFYF